jgi:hypothetical protein
MYVQKYGFPYIASNTMVQSGSLTTTATGTRELLSPFRIPFRAGGRTGDQATSQSSERVIA